MPRCHWTFVTTTDRAYCELCARWSDLFTQFPKSAESALALRLALVAVDCASVNELYQIDGWAVLFIHVIPNNQKNAF